MKVRAKPIILIFITLFILVALAFLACQGYNAQEKSSMEIVGKNTFTQSMTQADGSVAHFYATGDQNFNYLHDEKGNILLRNNGYVVYAKNQEGRPVPTNVKYQDAKDKIIALQKMTVTDIDFSNHPDLITEYPESQPSSLYQSANPSRPIVNFVIFISFAGESVSLDKNYIDSVMSGPSNSLTDYYQKVSYGEILVHNIYPVDGGEIFIYQDSQPRSYYQLSRTSSSRVIRERTLLNNAVEASKEYFDFGGLDIDINSDGYVDAVNFLISGSPYSEWGGMLWPHSWDLDDISNGDPATIGDKKVKKYAFNFLEQLTVGLLAHEFAHVLGAPDLYHYEDSYAAVGNWDLMHYEGDTPQYMTTHMRHKYLNALGENQISPIEFNGIYSLKPVTLTPKENILAYRINTEIPDEYFMVEYRNNNVSTYDSSLPGSGLIIYRVKQGVYGNADSLKNNPSKPDEVFIFRPNAVTTGTDAVRSVANLNRAYLSPDNSDFSSVGASLSDKPSSSFDSDTLYYTNGQNSGIIVTALSISDEEITFEVRLSGDNNVSDDYFADKLDMNNVKLNNDSEFSGVYSQLQVTQNINTANLSDIIIRLKSQHGMETASIRLDRTRFVQSYNNGLRNFPVRFIVNHKGNTSLISVFYDNVWHSFEKPETMELYVVDSDNDFIFLQQYNIDDSLATWQSIEMTNINYSTTIEASDNTTIAVRDDGKGIISSNISELEGLVLNDVISASAGDEHILYIKSNLKVTAAGNFESGENNVNGWENIIKVVAGDRTSFGLTLNGQVRSAGRMQPARVNEWYNIVDIAVGKEHIVALKSDGTAEAAGSNDFGQSQLSSWQDIIQISCGNAFTAGLKRDGTVLVAGSLNNKAQVEAWTDIVMIYAGANHLLGLTSAGRVFAAGNNSYNQLDTNSFYDVIDIAAGLYHSVALREDGELLYAGTNDNNTNNIDENIIFYDNNYVDATSLITPFTHRILKVGDTYQLNVGVFPENASYKKISYFSNQQTIVTVSPDGLMTAQGIGTATITAKHRGSDLEAVMVVEVIAHINTSAMIAAGSSHTALLNNKGTVYAMGNNDKGQTDVNLWGNIVYIAAGGDTTVGVTPEGNVLVAGSMADMGAEDWTDIAYVATSGKTIVGIKYDSFTVAVGDNQYEQTEFFNSFSNVKQVATSATHTVVLTNQNQVVAKGLNDRGQLNVENWRNIVKVAAGEGFSLGLTDTGKVYYTGQCGYLSDMTVLAYWYDIVDIAASNEHIVGINSKGKVFAVGNNSFGQTDVEGFQNIGRIAAGGQHTLAIDNDGEIIGAGRNSDNRLSLPSVNSLPFVQWNEVTVSQDVYGVKVGQTRRIDLKFDPYNATDRQSVTYSSSNPLIAEVDADGFITGIMTTGLSSPIQINITVQKSNQQTTHQRTIDVYVYESINSIESMTPPQKTVYSYQEKLDLLGGRVRINLGSGVSFETDITPDMVVNYESATSVLGERTVEIALGGGFSQYSIFVLDMATNVEIFNPSEIKKVYEYGDDIDLTGGYLRIYRGYEGANNYLMTQLLSEGSLEVIANTNLMGSTTVTLKYIDPIALEADITLVHYLTYVIDVLDAVVSVDAVLDKYSFNYGEEIYQKGYLLVNMKSGNSIYQDIVDIDDTYQPGIDTRVVIEDYNKYIWGIQNIKIRYINPDFDKVYDTTLEVSVKADITNVEITSMMLGDRAVVDTNRHPERSISARVYFAGGAVIDVGYDGENQFFADIRLAFSIGEGINDGPGSIAMYVRVNSSAHSEFQTRYTINNLAIFGLSQITELQIAGDNAFNYGAQTNLYLEIQTPGETYEVEIDDIMLGIDNTLLTSQTASFTLMGITATKQIIFNDYILEIFSNTSFVTTLYGEDPNITIYAAMASGAVEVVEGWTFENFDNQYEDHPQVVTIHYFSYTYILTIEVLNEIKEVTVYSTPKTFYEVNEPLDLSGFSIRLRFLSDEQTAPIYYNEDDFTVQGFDNTQTGVQLVSITYKITGDVWQYYFEVRNRIQQIFVDSVLSKRMYTVGEELALTVVLVYINGERDYITEGYQHNFDSTRLGEQVINLSYRGTYTTAFLVEIIDAPREIRIKPPTKIHYQYGEILDLSGGVVTIITQTGQRRNEALSVYRNYLTGYNSVPQTRGSQTIILSLSEYGVMASFKIYFAEKQDSNILIASNNVDTINIDRSNTRIVLDESATLTQFKQMVESYADIRFVMNESYIDVTENEDMYLSSNIKVEIINQESILLETFNVYLKGDANGDGVFDEEDIPLLAEALLAGLDHTAIYADYTGNKKYTLTDFVKWVEKAEQLQEEDSQQ